MFVLLFFFFFKQKTAYEMRISDWSSDVCSSDLTGHSAGNLRAPFRGTSRVGAGHDPRRHRTAGGAAGRRRHRRRAAARRRPDRPHRRARYGLGPLDGSQFPEKLERAKGFEPSTPTLAKYRKSKLYVSVLRKKTIKHKVVSNSQL